MSLCCVSTLKVFISSKWLTENFIAFPDAYTCTCTGTCSLLCSKFELILVEIRFFRNY